MQCGEKTMTARQYKVRPWSLNVREDPNPKAALLGKLHRGDVVEELGISDDRKWLMFRMGELYGWCVKGFLDPVIENSPPPEEFPWMPIAEREKGVSEVPGAGNNPRVVEYLHATSNLGEATRSKDETPWCSAFVNWCVREAGLQGTRSALARSWLSWGEPISTPRRGCIVVFERERIFGHVGFYLGETADAVQVLGGNQQDPVSGIYQVSEKYYPKSALLGYRVPKKT
jgi:uncharacterized protein (TIGR02594 family)